MIDPVSFREAIRTATVTYPVPFLVGVLLMFAVILFGMSTRVDDILRWIVAGMGTVSALAAIGSYGYAMLLKPELLRSESHALMTRYFDTLGDSDRDTKTRERVSHAILDVAEERGRKMSGDAEQDLGALPAAGPGKRPGLSFAGALEATFRSSLLRLGPISACPSAPT